MTGRERRGDAVMAILQTSPPTRQFSCLAVQILALHNCRIILEFALLYNHRVTFLLFLRVSLNHPIIQQRPNFFIGTA